MEMDIDEIDAHLEMLGEQREAEKKALKSKPSS